MNSHRLSALAFVFGACAAQRPAAMTVATPAQQPTPSPIATPAAADATAPSAPDANGAAPSPAAVVRACEPGETPPPRVADPPDELWAQRWSVRGDVSGLPAPVGRTCARFAAAARAARTPLAALIGGPDDPSTARFDEIGVCHAAGRGAWVLVPGAGRRRTLRSAPGTERQVVAELAWTLGFVRADGSVLRASDTHARGAAHSGDEGGDGSVRLVHDYDRDGTAEVLLVTTSGNPTSGHAPTSHGRLFSVRGNAIAPAPGAPDGEIEAPLDVDADGIPDLLVRSPYAADNTCGPAVFFGPMELAHARPDGTFARDDAHARSWMQRRCEGFETAPTDLFAESFPSSELPYRIACWRYWGVAADVLHTAARASWPADGEDHCTSREQALASMDVAPRFTLRTACH